MTQKEAAAEFHKSMDMLNDLANQAGDRARALSEKSERQTELLEKAIDRVQEHIRKGEYDDAELLLVDIEWTPVEPGSNADREQKAQYDRKREELRAIIERRSKSTSNP